MNDRIRAIFSQEDKDLGAFTSLLNTVGSKKVCYNKNNEAVSNEVANDSIRKVMYEVLEIPEGTKGAPLRKAIRRHQTEIFEIIEETLQNMVLTGWDSNPFFYEFVERKSAALGDTNEFWTKDNVILTVSELSGNHHNLFRQRLGSGKAFNVRTSWYGIKIYVEYERFMTGAIDWSEFIQKVYEAIDKKFNSMIFSTFTGIASYLPAGGQWVKTSQLNANTEDTFLQLVQDVATANGTDVVIMGTRFALAKLTNLEDVKWISDDMKKERNTTGRVGYFMGYRLVELPQVFADNDTTTRLVSNDVLYIMPTADNKFIKVFDEGDTQLMQVTDKDTNVDMTYEYEVQYKMGVAVVIGRLFGVWNILP